MTPTGTYHDGPDSARQPGLPQGNVTHFQHVSTIFPGARRDNQYGNWWRRSAIAVMTINL